MTVQGQKKSGRKMVIETELALVDETTNLQKQRANAEYVY